MNKEDTELVNEALKNSWFLFLPGQYHIRSCAGWCTGPQRTAPLQWGASSWSCWARECWSWPSSACGRSWLVARGAGGMSESPHPPMERFVTMLNVQEEKISNSCYNCCSGRRFYILMLRYESSAFAVHGMIHIRDHQNSWLGQS